MKHLNKTHYLYCLIAACALFAGCREKYLPKVKELDKSYLVVDGFINAGTGPTTIYLTQTTKVSDAVTKIIPVTGAKVSVDGPNSFTLAEVSPGVYQHPQLTLVQGSDYTLSVNVFNKVYQSAPSRVRRTPDIDSVFWRMENNGVQLYADTHDNTPVGYYQFRYEDTWEFISKYTTALKVFNRNGLADHIGYRDSITKADDLSIWRCWKTDTSRSILIASTAKLTKNQVSNFPLLYIEPGSVKLDIRYSINVRMYSLSQQAHTFQEQLKKNTELIGSIFDAQPSDNYGNMRCITDPSEPVMGYIEISEEKTKRIFINNAQVPNWNYLNSCGALVKFSNTPLELRGKDFYLPTQVSDGNIDSAWFAPKTCVDCTTVGTNKKPSFW